MKKEYIEINNLKYLIERKSGKKMNLRTFITTEMYKRRREINYMLDWDESKKPLPDVEYPGWMKNGNKKNSRN